MTLAIVDTLTPIVTILKADGDIAALVGTKVFGTDLPRDQSTFIEGKATKAIVVSPRAGGDIPSVSRFNPLETRGLDVFCYGETLIEADVVRRTVFATLKNIDRDVASGVLVHWCLPAGGAASGKDSETDWPVYWNSWQMMADTRSAV